MSGIDNRVGWNVLADDYQRRHGAALERTAEAWGVWRIPEEELGILGDVAGRDVLELGCGAAQWACALATRGAKVVGLDLSDRQLQWAREAVGRSSAAVRLVQGRAESLPFADASFDVVMADHGALGFAPPELAVPEAARLLRPGGLLAFAVSTPLLELCWDPATEAVGERLVRRYFGMHRLDDAEATQYQLPYGEWIRLFRRSGLRVEDLVELRPPEGATTTWDDYVALEWARRWPAEQVWKVVRER